MSEFFPFIAPIQHHHTVCNNPEYSKYITLQATGSPNKNKMIAVHEVQVNGEGK